ELAGAGFRIGLSFVPRGPARAVGMRTRWAFL
ncbi:unnamed protein product, partial [marine sediment metagenome]